jgi:PAS domain S-box-containing protein
MSQCAQPAAIDTASTAILVAGPASLDPVRLVESSDMPALITGADGRVYYANAAAAPLGVLLSLPPGHRSAGELLVMIGQVARSSAAQQLRIRVDQFGDAAAARVFDLTLLPIECGSNTPHTASQVMILGREATYERNLVTALSASRDLYRDLIACSSDFAWETDVTGAFVFVSTDGALGWHADALNGATPDRFELRINGAAPEHCPFRSDRPVNGIEVQARGADGKPRHLVISARPVHDANGVYRGSRGIARDVTDIRQREAELAMARRRERLVNAISRTMLSDQPPRERLAQAVTIIAEATGAPGCAVIPKDGDGHPEARAAITAWNAPATLAPDWVGIAGMVKKEPPEGRAVLHGEKKGYRFTTAAVPGRGDPCGWIVLVRDGPEGGDDPAMLTAIADPIGYALMLFLIASDGGHSC